MLKKLFSLQSLLWILIALVVLFFVFETFLSKESFCLGYDRDCKSDSECCSKSGCSPNQVIFGIQYGKKCML
jgi:hypothetical protein